MMTEEKFDRRVLRTKQQIRQALIELLAEKGEANIAVRELAQRANINRGTFYIHYRDIHDLVGQLMDEAIEDLLKKYEVRRCFYGHLHGPSHALAMEGLWDGIEFRLVAADKLNFRPFTVIS